MGKGFQTGKEIVERGLQQIYQELQEKDREIRRLRQELRIANMNTPLMVKVAADIAGRTPATIWNWKKDGLQETEKGRVMYADLIRFLSKKDPDRVRELGFDPEHFTK